MNNQKRMEKLVSEWPGLKKRAQNEDDPENLIAIIEEIDELLCVLEVRMAAQDASEDLNTADHSKIGAPRLASD